ncbi:MAG: SpoIVB peptidase S55 domain-containing protein [Lachnospiraceae bacterium]|nr:SpoIVB peptidase S55 domain-containing protein [Lachnospiraceae bacterium]
MEWYQEHRKLVAISYGVVYVIACYLMLLSYIPGEVNIERNAGEIKLAAPVTVEPIHDENVLAVGQNKGAVGTTQRLQCKLFGVIPVGSIEATVTEEQKVDAVGSPVGIYLKMQNVYVAGTKELRDAKGDTANPGAYIVKEGDYIVGVNGGSIQTKEQLQCRVEESQGEPLVLTLLRKNEYMDVRIQPVLTEGGDYKLGLWVKDDTAGVGTITYIDEDGRYGALGHGISNTGTENLILMERGYLYHASITSVTPSSVGSPGEITGLITYGENSRYGNVATNSNVGIFGNITATAEAALNRRTYSVGRKQDMKREEAIMLFGTEGQVKSYQIAIDQIDLNPKEKNKAFVFHVTEPALIEQTGGIVQGMSGSPIIQEGKIVGAVTHVFINDPTKGYGIFIEDMLDH